MEDLKRLNSVLKDIDDLCVAIKKATVGVMTMIRDEGKDFASDIQEEKPHIDISTIVQMLKNESVALCEDARKVSEELKTFGVVLANGKNIKECECPTLREVWCGDAYDGRKKLDGLLALKQDLEDQLENANVETVIERVLEVEKE